MDHVFHLPTDTAHVRIESRQYRLLNYDLGEGIRRSSMKVAALITVPWLLFMALLSVSVVQLPWLWIGPPAIGTYFATSRDESGRVRLRSWVDAIAFKLGTSRHVIVNAESASGAVELEDVEAEFAVIDVRPV